ncbi:hypothetical protein NQ317_012874 [Molorchus minor]|uniref:Uncharacterized protein n=1 Tax=Molorchus minor TaxID=1323400 RepID=A0ABQ9J6G5_9CUCU|nr:hypothetical protein NQ317_012874 [Molorchus minor]
MLWDESNAEKTILLTHLNIVKLKVDTRGAASSLKVNVRIDDLQTLGMRQEDFVPEMVNSENDQSRHGLLEVTFETNPLDGKCDQRIELVAKPIRICLENSDLDQIQAAAGSGLFNVKEMTSTGMAHTIETHARLDINVDLSAPYVIIPYGGKYTGEENVLVLNLGRLKNVLA